MSSIIYSSPIVPVRLVPDANFIRIEPAGVGPTGPVYRIFRGQFIPGSPAQDAVPQKSGPGLPGYEPAKDAVPAVPDKFIVHESTDLILTQAEWDNWDKTKDDATYILGIAASRTSSILA